MLEDFEVTVDGTSYTLRRMYHEDLDLTYHIHLHHDEKLMVFRMGLFGDEWEILPQKLPLYVRKAKEDLEKAIRENEADR